MTRADEELRRLQEERARLGQELDRLMPVAMSVPALTADRSPSREERARVREIRRDIASLDGLIRVAAANVYSEAHPDRRPNP